MSTGVLHVDLPESLLLSTGQSREEFIREAKLLLETRQGCGHRFGEAEPCARGKTLDGPWASLPEKRGRRK